MLRADLGGRQPQQLVLGDTNATGSYATVLGTDNPGTQITPPASPNLSPNSSAAATPNPGTADSNWVPQSASPASVAPPITASTVYIQKDPSSGLQPLVNLGSPTPPLDAQGTQGQFGAIHGDIHRRCAATRQVIRLLHEAVQLHAHLPHQCLVA